jgi:hypothetical protein
MTRPGLRPGASPWWSPDSHLNFGKVERFNRAVLDGWAYARPYASEAERRAALPSWLHTDNITATTPARRTTASRVTNLSGRNT